PYRALVAFRSFPTRRSSDLALIAFRAAGLFHRYILQPDVSLSRRLALFVPAVASHAGVLTAIVAVFLLACAALPRRRRSIAIARSEEHTSELQSRENLVCRL